MSKRTNSISGFKIALILTVFFTILKLFGLIDWSWIWVICPIWIGLGMMLLIVFLILLVIKIFEIIYSK